jgi:hypothetical protein
VVGEVLRTVECRPALLVLPRRLGGQYRYAGQVLLWSRDGTPIHVEVASAPPEVSASVGPVAGREDQRWLRVEWQPLADAPRRQDAEVRIRLRARRGGRETELDVPVLLTEKPS